MSFRWPDFAHYQPADSVEAAHLAEMKQLCQSEDSWSRAHEVPGHFTASAFVISPDSTAVLLIEHSKLHRWLQPGGHIEATDVDIEAAARREVREEVGLVELERIDLAPNHVLFDLDIHTIPARGTTPSHRHFDVRLLFRSHTWEVKAGSDALAAKWFSYEQITSIETDESVTRAIRKLRSLR